MIPRATYRLQLHAGFTFADAEAIVPYLADLGISHVYASPVTMAAKGSMHGYDVIDPTRINPELGGQEGLASLVMALHAQDMGLIIDIVPNHMGVAGDENPYWMDVLEKGRASPHAALFDIDWPADGAGGPIALPVLGAPLDEVIAAGDMRLVERKEGLGLQLYGGPIYPVRPDDPAQAERRTDITPETLKAIAERQHYRLLYWRMANDCLNWRRFFSINELAGVRAEDPAVFAFTHQLYFDLFRHGLIDGVRVDHVDGLADPATYCCRLREGLENAAPDRRPYIVVEKILATGEALPAWPVDGTSGYDFMREAAALLHDPSGVAPLGALWERISGRPADFAAEALEGRRDVLSCQFEGQLTACIDSFAKLARSDGMDWPTHSMIRRAIERLLHVFPTYRTYGTGADAPPGDKPMREAARAAMTVPPGEGPVADLILQWLAGEGGGDLALRAEAVRRFQQLSAPIAAKGVEDTAFYRHGVLLSANDVGFDPAHMTTTIADFHIAMQERARTLPHAMLATATHDHKRGEDARARLAVLSSISGPWEDAVGRWTALAAPDAGNIDPADVYMLLQALVGAWDAEDDNLPGRIQDWQRKALREAKLRSCWEAPNEAYEERCATLVTTLLSGPFREDFARFMTALAPAAFANSLAQTALRYCLPGVPDLYQGCELADTSMVDPDNRRPVDFALRASMLTQTPADPKMRLIAALLDLRDSDGALSDGGYRPLPVSGSRAGHILAFERRHGEDIVYCVIALRMGGALFGSDSDWVAPSWWQDTLIGSENGGWRADDLLARGPAAVWRPGKSPTQISLH